MKLYCMVNELKPECVKDYAEYHESIHKTEWKTQLTAIKKAGFEVCNVYVHGNLSIVIFGCDDLMACLSKLAADTDNKRWQQLMAGFFAGNPKFDGEKDLTAKKVFDLIQQMQGYLKD
jgi:L-rhamnose mutarotase